MSHNIFGDKFFSHREVPWHKLGIVSQEPQSAEQALEKIGNYHVYIEGVQTFSGLEIPEYRVILRAPTPSDNSIRVFGLTGKEYKLVTPHDVAMIWDESVTQPVETMGALGYGETFFVSTTLPDFKIKDDEVKSYMLFVSPMTGFDAAELRITPVRVVCQNTLSAAKQMSTEVYRMVHNPQILDNMRKWLSGIYERAVERAEALRQAFEIFSEFGVPEEQEKEILSVVYQDAKRPRFDVPQDIFDRRMVDYQYWQKQVENRRAAVSQLFHGRMTGYDSEAVKDSAYGLYNAIVEFEDFRPSGGKTIAAARNALFGDRAGTKEKAFAVIADRCHLERELAGYKPEEIESEAV